MLRCHWIIILCMARTLEGKCADYGHISGIEATPTAPACWEFIVEKGERLRARPGWEVAISSYMAFYIKDE